MRSIEALEDDIKRTQQMSKHKATVKVAALYVLCSLVVSLAL
jgi:hypothetical protein